MNAKKTWQESFILKNVTKRDIIQGKAQMVLEDKHPKRMYQFLLFVLNYILSWQV